MKKRVGKILFWLCIVVCVLGLAYIAIYYFRKDKNEDVYQKVQKQVEEKKQEEDAEDEIPIDFASLKETNPDIYAWIEIPDTNVNYPIVQSADDDSYYLNHTIDGQEGYPGSIYTEKVNAKDFSDFNTVIYGHDMKTVPCSKIYTNLKMLIFLNSMIRLRFIRRMSARRIRFLRRSSMMIGI